VKPVCMSCMPEGRAAAQMVDGGASMATSDAGCAPPELHLISWNVAGWKTTFEHIKRFKGGFSNFLNRHHADILCLQEVKLSAKVLAADGVKLGAEVPGYDSFWACNEGAGAQRSGLNGVATFARQGTVLRADGAPLGDPALDSEGRCLLTDHGAFVLFNVYVPNTSGGGRLPFKMRWLHALRAAMARERAAGRRVILAGDLNLKHRAADSHWSFQLLAPARLQELAGSDETLEPDSRRAIDLVAGAWPGIVEALRSKEHRPFETRNSHSGQTYQRWGVFAKSKAGEVVRLGAPMDSEDCARGSFLLAGLGVERDGTVVAGPDAEQAAFVLRRSGLMYVGDLVECLKKLAQIELGPRVLRQLCGGGLGQVPVAPALQDWLQEVLELDGMVDSFAALHPEAEERFTCWDQYKNKRYENVGSRIDYILVDAALFQGHARRGADLQAHAPALAAGPASAMAALSAATLGGLSTPSSFAGGGMQALEEDEYEAQFQTSASTGIVYTPPQLSDHVAVSLLLSGLPPPSATGGGLGGRQARDPATQRCQPHKSAKRITDFFTKRPPGSNSGSVLPEAKRAK